MSFTDDSHVSRRSPDAGASLVEFALLAPVVFALLLGMITGGLALSAKNSMSNAVREGGRLGATLESDATWGTDVRDRVVALAGGDLEESQVCAQLIDVGPDPDEVRQSWIGSACTVAEAPTTPASATSGCIAKVWAKRTADLSVIFFSRTLTLEADAVGVYERGAACSSAP